MFLNFFALVMILFVLVIIFYTFIYIHEYGEDVEALHLPTGAQASVAVYTHNFHAISIVRKVILGIKSWENLCIFYAELRCGAVAANLPA